MALVGITEAARLVGVSEKTIRRKIDSGILSAQVSEHAGHQKKSIDTSELVRVFGKLLGQAPPDIVQAVQAISPVMSTQKMDAPGHDGHALSQAIETQKAHISSLEHQVDWLKHELDVRAQEVRDSRAQVTQLLEWRRPDPVATTPPAASTPPAPAPIPPLSMASLPRRYIVAGVTAAGAIAAVAWSWGAGYRLWFLL